MTNPIADHWGTGDVYGLIVSALSKMSKPPRFFTEAYRVLKPGAFFALTEHGLGPKGEPHYPVPWSADGTGAYLVTPSETRVLLEKSGFEGRH